MFLLIYLRFSEIVISLFFTKILQLLLKKKVQHFVIPVAICNKIVALCNNTCRKLVTNLKWMFGGQVNPIISIIIDNNNNNSFFLTRATEQAPVFCDDIFIALPSLISEKLEIIFLGKIYRFCLKMSRKEKFKHAILETGRELESKCARKCFWGVVTRDAQVSYWPVFSMSQVTSPETLTKS